MGAPYIYDISNLRVKADKHQFNEVIHKYHLTDDDAENKEEEYSYLNHRVKDDKDTFYTS
jgi:hypothetical protein